MHMTSLILKRLCTTGAFSQTVLLLGLSLFQACLQRHLCVGVIDHQVAVLH